MSHPRLISGAELILPQSAFYDGGRTSGQAGDFVFKTVVPALKAACPGKKVYITEYVYLLALEFLLN